MNTQKSRYGWCMLVALAFHGCLFMTGYAFLGEKADFGMDQGASSLEVQLVAAPAESKPAVQPTLEAIQELQPEEIPDEVVEDIVEEPRAVVEMAKIIPEMKPLPKPTPVEIPHPQVQPPTMKEKGDGSSRLPGKDSTTVQSAGGADHEAKPDYLKNPAPVYPERARRRGQSGEALLRVEVSDAGVPEVVTLEKSSGYPLLDDAALKAVRKWKFKSASLGGLNVASTVEVPIRFELEK